MKAVIFDLDGVIVFTDKFHYQAWKIIADKLGIYFDEIINNRLRGVSRAKSLEIINTYCSTDYFIDALLDKLTGKSGFKGKSPVDPFCGKWDTRL